ncbi:hypothetical protein [Oceanicoccus sp. KOV_DT_Chl]|uniref:hypothetical protein n=1 Tax=Oceanicoccus sp. KOV_DT_Chl TaxID=1904639 RepID=UPI00135C382A|nr:hypothetical protein [Oceanicoccus sp. KOV_DT_Chl]
MKISYLALCLFFFPIEALAFKGDDTSNTPSNKIMRVGGVITDSTRLLVGLILVTGS